MHPGMMAWWHARRHASCGEGACESHAGPWGRHGGHGGHGPGEHGPGGHGPGPGGGGGGEDFGGFGVRRPLRFLAFKLELEEAQVTELATILSELKTERAQAAVDQRRTTASLADAVAAEAFDEGKAKTAADERNKSNERVQTAVVQALGRIHALLKPEQRAKLAYLLRTGALSI
ncbi:MAG TPA: periplasmic heavy metal sensor [Polyangiaceae bacterium]|nr:periplasmic heavy metal sensor [Polyangiaceae bacterium]